ncbi:cytochrome c oxidase assembly protein [Nocardia panacis]|uniref:Cytochrome c oxidase assembly protein n=1 Tax=Nocardia panacis TaxID=2340916 RepID=A0A3A4KBZ5_9NOCA|nr:cytochrome c oxidase assembly protein [Nocardia panacis]RJO70158.1 cytochrome c oxidase assembly protein [Nocardia panacis]
MDTPLTVGAALGSWRWDTSTVLVTAALGAGYLTAWSAARRRGTAVPTGRVVTFLAAGLGVWLLTGISVIGVYSNTLFWMRALQMLLLLYVVPFGLASGKPVTVLRDALGPAGRSRLDRILGSGFARALTFPAVGSLLILVTPWLLYLSPWLPALLRAGWVDIVSRLLMVVIGFIYFYARLQADPVPRRYTQSISLLITVFESLADGVLGLVLWLGPLLASDYYEQVGRTWGPDPRMDQIIGAGVIWLLGDVLGLPFLLVLMRSFAADERRKARTVDAELDAAEAESRRAAPTTRTAPAVEESGHCATSGLWWENDPQLRDRFRR